MNTRLLTILSFCVMSQVAFAVGKTAMIIVDMQKDFCCPSKTTKGCEAQGALYVEGCELLVSKIAKFKSQVDVVVHTQDWHLPGHYSFASRFVGCETFKCCDAGAAKPKTLGDDLVCKHPKQVVWPDHCVQNSEGAKLMEDIFTQGEYIHKKGTNIDVDSYSGFLENDEKVSFNLDENNKKRSLQAYLQKQLVKHVAVVGVAMDYCVGNTAVDGKKLKAGTTLKVFDSVIVLSDLTKAVNPTTMAAMKTRLGEDYQTSKWFEQHFPKQAGAVNKRFKTVRRLEAKIRRDLAKLDELME